MTSDLDHQLELKLTWLTSWLSKADKSQKKWKLNAKQTTSSLNLPHLNTFLRKQVSTRSLKSRITTFSSMTEKCNPFWTCCWQSQWNRPCWKSKKRLNWKKLGSSSQSTTSANRQPTTNGCKKSRGKFQESNKRTRLFILLVPSANSRCRPCTSCSAYRCPSTSWTGASTTLWNSWPSTLTGVTVSKIN